MTYASGGLIQASDFNTFNGPSTGSAASVNQVWATGNGDCGYGQSSPGANVSVGGTVAATDWATLINHLNTIYSHQAGSTSGISAPTAGSTISYLSTLNSSISTAYTNRLNYTGSGSGTTTTSAKTVNIVASAGAAGSGSISWTIAWPSVDQARYFFNAGGNYYIFFSSFTNTGGTSRGSSILTLAQTNYNSKRVYSHTMGARAGTGGTVNTDTTNAGYYEITGSATDYCKITSSGYYSGDYVSLTINNSGGAGSYGGNGSSHVISFNAYSSTTGSTQPSDSIDVTLGMTLALVYPNTTYLSASWGTATIT